MAATNLAEGNIMHHRLHPTRTEADFLLFVKGIVVPLPSDEQVILLADQPRGGRSIRICPLR